MISFQTAYFPGGSDGKEPACCTGDPGSIPESGRSPGEGNGNPLQNSSLKNSMDRGAWWATYRSWSHKESDMTERLTLSLSQEPMVLSKYPRPSMECTFLTDICPSVNPSGLGGVKLLKKKQNKKP